MSERGDLALSDGCVVGSGDGAHELGCVVESRSDGERARYRVIGEIANVVVLPIERIAEHVVKVVREVDRLDAEAFASLQVGAQIDDEVGRSISPLPQEPAEERRLGVAGHLE